MIQLNHGPVLRVAGMCNRTGMLAIYFFAQMRNFGRRFAELRKKAVQPRRFVSSSWSPSAAVGHVRTDTRSGGDWVRHRRLRGVTVGWRMALPAVFSTRDCFNRNACGQGSEIGRFAVPFHAPLAVGTKNA